MIPALASQVSGAVNAQMRSGHHLEWKVRVGSISPSHPELPIPLYGLWGDCCNVAIPHEVSDIEGENARDLMNTHSCN